MTKIRTVCDPSNPQDRNTILLGELVDDRFNIMKDEIAHEIVELRTSVNSELSSMRTSIDNTLSRIEPLVGIVDNIVKTQERCPVYRNIKNAEFIMFMMDHPKVLILSLVGSGIIVGISVVALINSPNNIIGSIISVLFK